MPDNLTDTVRMYRRQLGDINAKIAALQAQLQDLQQQRTDLQAARDDITAYLLAKGVTP